MTVSHTFFAPISTDEPNQFRLPITDPATVQPGPGRHFLMGGVAVGAAAMAMEHSTGRPLIWTTAQFISAGPASGTVDIEVEEMVVGGKVTQARATLMDGDRLVLTANATLGGRSDRPEAQIISMPSVPPPMECDVKTADYRDCDDLQRRFEKRMAYQSDEDGIERLWFRPVAGEPMSTGLLAIIGDFVGGATSMTRGCTSLDNTLRIHRIVASDWILADTQILGMANGAFHGHTRLFAEDGTLLAIAGQSAMLRRPE